MADFRRQWDGRSGRCVSLTAGVAGSVRLRTLRSERRDCVVPHCAADPARSTMNQPADPAAGHARWRVFVRRQAPERVCRAKCLKLRPPIARPRQVRPAGSEGAGNGVYASLVGEFARNWDCRCPEGGLEFAPIHGAACGGGHHICHYASRRGAQPQDDFTHLQGHCAIGAAAVRRRPIFQWCKLPAGQRGSG